MRQWADLPRPVRRALRWDAISATLGGLFSGGLVPFVAVIARSELRASAYMIAVLTASAAVGNLFNPLVAHRIRNRPKLPHAVWPLLAGRSCYLLLPLALTAPIYIAICFSANLIASLNAPAYAAVMRDAYPAARRGELIGWVRSLFVAGAMVGALAGGMALAQANFRVVFPAVTVVGLLSSAAFARIGVVAAPDESAPAKGGLIEAFREVRENRAFGLYCTCFYLYGLGSLVTAPAVPLLQVDTLRITPQWVGYLATTTSACSLLGYPYWGRVLDRQGPFRMMLMVIAVLSISPLTYLFAHSVPVLLIAAAASGFAVAGGDLGYVNAALRFGSRETTASYAGMFAFFQACRGIPGPFIGAAIATAIGARWVFLVGLALWVAAAAMLVGRGGLCMPTEHES